MQNDLDPKGLEAARSAIRYLSSPSTPWSDEQVGAVIRAYLSAVPDGEGELVEALHHRIDEYWRVAWREGSAGRVHDNEDNDASRVRSEIDTIITTLAASRLSQAGVRGPNDKWSDREPIYEAAIAAYEANTPKDYRYSALAMVKAVDAAIAAISGDTP